MYDGIINVYKERGFTSHDVVAKLRGILKQRKIGHTGTLDPEAEGVLPVCVGKGTKLADMLTGHDKTYRAVLLLGTVTDTQDTTGAVQQVSDVSALDEETVQETILSFTGEYQQIPPMYSALKVGGRKLYELAREGKEVERRARPVTIHEITIESVRLPEVTMTVSCSKGTYIRTLCHDIGGRLSVGGCMKSLTRTRAGQFRLEDSLRLSEIEALRDAGELEKAVLPLEKIFEAYRVIRAGKETLDKLVSNGNPFRLSEISGDARLAAETDGDARLAAETDGDGRLAGGIGGDGRFAAETDGDARLAADGERFRVYGLNGQFIGVYEYSEEKRMFCPSKIFLGGD